MFLKLLYRKETGQSINLSGAFNASVLNSLWSILTGKRYELDDPKFTETISLLISNLQGVYLTFPGFFFPWPAKFGLVGRKLWKASKVLRVKMRALIDENYQSHVSTYQEGVTRDFIDAFLNEISKSGKDSSFYGKEGGLCIKKTLFLKEKSEKFLLTARYVQLCCGLFCF